MKRFLSSCFFVLALLVVAFPAFAQDSANLITLNDATPAIDVGISLPADTTGTVSLKVAQAAVTLTDSANRVVFHAADARLHAVDLNIAPNSGSHTLTIERLAGFSEAYVTVESLPELTITGSTEHISGSAVTLNQEIGLPLDAAVPGGSATLSIPDGTTGVVTAAFPGSNAAAQFVDTQGVIVAQSAGGHVDGINLVLDAGNYAFTVLSSGLTRTAAASVRVVSVADTGISLLEMPASAEVVTAGTPNTACTAAVVRGSVNLRSGPGTGYSITGYAYFNENYPAGGRNPENNWIVVGTGSSSAWIAQSGVSLQGACDALPVFNIPLRDAPLAPIIITTPQASGRGGEYEEHEDEEHEDDD